MDRRGFLEFLGALCLDPERLLWRPHGRLISIPKFVRPGAAQAFLRLLDSNSVELTGGGYARAPIGAFEDVARHAFRGDVSCCFPEARGEWKDVAAAEVVDRTGRPVLLPSASFGPIGLRFRVTLSKCCGDRDPITVSPGGSLRVSLRPPWPDRPPPVNVIRKA